MPSHKTRLDISRPLARGFEPMTCRSTDDHANHQPMRTVPWSRADVLSPFDNKHRHHINLERFGEHWSSLTAFSAINSLGFRSMR